MLYLLCLQRQYCIFQYLPFRSTVALVHAVNVYSPLQFLRVAPVAAKELTSCGSALLAQMINVELRFKQRLSFLLRLRPVLSTASSRCLQGRSPRLSSSIRFERFKPSSQPDDQQHTSWPEKGIPNWRMIRYLNFINFPTKLEENKRG